MLLDDTRAVVVAPTAAEPGRPGAPLVDLAAGAGTPVRTPAPAAGGAWAMHGDGLRYPATGPRRTYCLAARDLPSGEAQFDHCAAPGEGFSQLTMSEAGTAMLAFDDRRPPPAAPRSCSPTGPPYPSGAPRCRGWDAAATGPEPSGPRCATSAGSAAAGSSPRRRRHDPAGGGRDRHADAVRRLGLLRRRPDQGRADAGPALAAGARLEVAYRFRRHRPRFRLALHCAGDVLNLTVLSDDGDEQVWANVD